MSYFKGDLIALKLKNEVQEFLMGISSNNLQSPCNAFLDRQGRIIATFAQKWINDDLMWLVVASSVLERVQQHLKQFLLFSKSEMEVTNRNVYWCFDSMEIESDEVLIDCKNYSLLITEHERQTLISQGEFDWLRLQHHIVLQGVDFNNQMLLNVSEEFVDYEKGCFLGQEVIARVHYKSKPPKKLVRVCLDDLSTEERANVTSVVINPDDGREYGFLFVKNG